MGILHRYGFKRSLRSWMLFLGLAPGFELLAAAEPALPTRDRPNILFIFMDDLGWKDTSFMGSDFYETPNLDQLAAQGMVFTDAYSCAANCAPARACLLSGQYTPRHQVFNVGTGPRGNTRHRKLEHIPGTATLRPDIKTWAHCVREAGYVTATMGKWHLSDDPRPYGFDVNIGGTHGGGPPGGYFPPHRGAPGLENAPKGEYLTDRLHDEAIEFITTHRSRSWLLYLTHFAVHTPLQARKNLVERYQAKPSGSLHRNPTMAAMMHSVDEGVGRVVDTLNRLGLRKKTVIIFFSDNGGYGPATSMLPLKGYKGTYYEGGIRVPFFVNWPGVVKPGTVKSDPVIGVDLYPTLCAISGAEMPKSQPCDGINLVPLLQGQPELPVRALFWHFPAYLQSYGGGTSRSGNQRDPLFRTRPCSVVRVGDFKLHEYFEDGGLELYNLREDIGERRNLVQVMPEKAAELHQRLKAWREAVQAPVPDKPNPGYDPKAEAAALEGSRQRK